MPAHHPVVDPEGAVGGLPGAATGGGARGDGGVRRLEVASPAVQGDFGARQPPLVEKEHGEADEDEGDGAGEDDHQGDPAERVGQGAAEAVVVEVVVVDGLVGGLDLDGRGEGASPDGVDGGNGDRGVLG